MVRGRGLGLQVHPQEHGIIGRVFCRYITYNVGILSLPSPCSRKVCRSLLDDLMPKTIFAAFFLGLSISPIPLI